MPVHFRGFISAGSRPPKEPVGVLPSWPRAAFLDKLGAVAIRTTSLLAVCFQATAVSNKVVFVPVSPPLGTQFPFLACGAECLKRGVD